MHLPCLPACYLAQFCAVHHASQCHDKQWQPIGRTSTLCFLPNAHAGKLRQLGWTKDDLVTQTKLRFSGLGLPRAPAIENRTLSKMNLRGVAGIEVAPPQQRAPRGQPKAAPAAPARAGPAGGAASAGGGSGGGSQRGGSGSGGGRSGGGGGRRRGRH